MNKIERKPYSLLMYDNFLDEFVDDDGYTDSHPTIENAHWAAVALHELLIREQRDLGNIDVAPTYKVYVVGPDGSLTNV